MPPKASTVQTRNRYSIAELAFVGTHFHWQDRNEQGQRNILRMAVCYSPACNVLSKKYKLAQTVSTKRQGANL
jgi:hypothetical protein